MQGVPFPLRRPRQGGSAAVEGNFRRPGEGKPELEKLIAEIEAATDSPTLVDLKEFIDRASAKGAASANEKKGSQ